MALLCNVLASLPSEELLLITVREILSAEAVVELLSLDSMAVLCSVTCHLLFCIILQIIGFSEKYYFENSKQILEGDWKMNPSVFVSAFGITDHKSINR